MQHMVDMVGATTRAGADGILVFTRDIIHTPACTALLIEELWREYEGASTPCAQLVKDFDKVLRHNHAIESF